MQRIRSKENQNGVAISDGAVSLGKGRFSKFKNNRADYIFMAIILIFPTLQFLIFYIGVNFNSFLLSFKQLNEAGDYEFIKSFKNFEEIIYRFKNAGLTKTLWNSVLVYLLNLFVMMPLGVLSAYYIFKKFVGHKIFKVMLFLPNIISSFTLCYIYSYFVNEAIYDLATVEWGFVGEKFLVDIAGNPYLFPAILFSNIFFGLGGSMLLYLGAMNAINDSVLEAAQVDGVNNLQMLFKVVLPQIYSTLSTFLVVGIAGIFTNQFNLVGLFTLFAPTDYQTLGYHFYQVLTREGEASYPYLAAFGIVISLILIPITLGLQKLLDRWDPNND